MNTNLKELIKLVTPPLAIKLYWRYKYGKPLQVSAGYFWDGVYDDFGDVPTKSGGYLSDEWLSSMRSHTEGMLAESRKEEIIPQLTIGERGLLSIVSSLICQLNKPERVRILDFGGGMGVDYIRLMSTLPKCTTIDYHVVDLESSCELGTQIFAGDPRIHFHPALPPDLADVDIVFINSGLIFIKDYLTMLDALCSYRPTCFLFVRLDAGKIPTHARAQKNIEGSVFPCWFFNINEINHAMNGNGYSLIFRAAAEQVYEEGNYPKEYRLGRACNLLFARNR